MFRSGRLLMIGAILFVIGVGLFYWGLPTDLIAVSSAEPQSAAVRGGPVAGALAAVGFVAFAGGVVQRLRGR